MSIPHVGQMAPANWSHGKCSHVLKSSRKPRFSFNTEPASLNRKLHLEVQPPVKI